MYKQFTVFTLTVAIASLAFYILIASVLGHEERQAERDFELQLNAASWLIEL